MQPKLILASGEGFNEMQSQVLKASPEDYLARLREIISDPCNSLIRRVPLAGFVGCEHESGEQFVLMHNGLLVPHGQYYGHFADILIINREVHEPQEELIFGMVMQEIPDGEPMVELGASWGFYSAWFKRLHPASQVFLIEPKAAHLSVGPATFRLNNLQGNFVEGICGVAGGLNLGVLAEQEINKISLLHVDIQGSAQMLLRGIRPLLAERKIRFLFISTHSQKIYEGCRDELASEDYRIVADANFDSGTYSCDGVIVACESSVVFNHVPLWSRGAGATFDSAFLQ